VRPRGGHFVSFVSGAGSTAICNWNGPNQLWVADITYVAIIEGFAYVALILDAWSRWAVGYAISRSIDVRLLAA
jgi:transposase InsO family protein